MNIKNIDNEYKPLVNDLIKMTTLLIVVNILMYLSDPNNKLLGGQYIKIMIFILLGITTYWLIIEKLINQY